MIMNSYNYLKIQKNYIKIILNKISVFIVNANKIAHVKTIVNKTITNNNYNVNSVNIKI